MAREFTVLIDVRQFGAQGDGINDDGPAFRAAIAALNDSGGYKGAAVGAAPGRYLIRTPVTVPDGLSIKGVGVNTVIIVGTDPAPVAFSGFIVPDGATAYFSNLQFRGPTVAIGTVYAVEKQGTAGDVFFDNVTAANVANAGVYVPAGCRFALDDCAEIGNDYAPIITSNPLFYLGDGLWGGANSTQPRQVKGFVNPSLGGGVAAPEGSFYQEYAAGAGATYVKTGAPDTAWSQIVTGGGGGVTLDGAYDFGGAGAGRTITVDAGAVQMIGNGADNNNVLEVTKSPVGAQSGAGVLVTMGAQASGAALSVAVAGSGAALNVAGGGVLMAAGGVTTFIDSADSGNAAVSAANHGRLRYNQATQTWQVSQNGGAYGNLLESLQGAYTAGAAGVSQIVTVTAGNGGVLIRDAAVSIASSLFSVTNNAQTSFWLDIDTSGNVTTDGVITINGSILNLVNGFGNTTKGRFSLSGTDAGVQSLNAYRLTMSSATGEIAALSSGLSFSTGTNLYIDMATGGTAAVSGANHGRLRYNSGTQTFQVSLNGAAYADVTTGAGGGTLDTAYDFGGAGAGRTITVDAGAVVMTGNAADNNNVLEINKAPVGAQSGAGIAVTLGANASGDCLSVSTSGSGRALNAAGIVLVSVNTASVALTVTQSGAGDAITATGNVSVSTGNVSVSAGGLNLTAGAGTTFIDSADSNTAAVSAANHGRIRYNSGTQTWQVSLNTAAYIDIATGVTGVTLDGAYDFGGAGAGRTITVDAGAVQMTGNGADNNNVLEVTKSPVGAQSGNALDITAGANATGNAVNLTQSGSGKALSVALGSNTGAQALVVTGTVATTNAAISVTNTTTGATGEFITLSKVSAAATAGNVMSITAGANTSGTALAITQSGSGKALTVALGSNTGAQALVVTGTVATTNAAISVTNTTTGATGEFITLSKVSAAATAGNVMSITAGANTSGHALALTQSGTGAALSISGGALNLAAGAITTFIDSADSNTAAVSAASHGRIRYNSGTQTWQVSLNTAAYIDIATAAYTLQQAYDANGSGLGRVITVASSLPVQLKRAQTTLTDATVVALDIRSDDYTAANKYSPILSILGSVTGPNPLGFSFQARPVSSSSVDIYMGQYRSGNPFFATFLHYDSASDTWIYNNGSSITLAENAGSGGTYTAPVFVSNKATGGYQTSNNIAWLGSSRYTSSSGAFQFDIPNGIVADSNHTLWLDSAHSKNLMGLTDKAHLVMYAKLSDTLSAVSTGEMRYNDTSKTMQLSLNAGSWTDIATSLQTAYAGGATTDGTNGAVAMSNAGANNTSVLTVNKSPAGAQSGSVFTVTAGANCTGIAVDISQSGTGAAINVSAGVKVATLTQSAATTGSPTAVLLTLGAHTTLTASVEAPDVDVNGARTVQFAQGALTTQRMVVFRAPTYAFATGAATLTNAATVGITGAPAAGTNATLTNRYGLLINSTGVADTNIGVISTQAQTGAHVVIQNNTASANGDLLTVTRQPASGSTSGHGVDIKWSVTGGTLTGNAILIDASGGGTVNGNLLAITSGTSGTAQCITITQSAGATALSITKGGGNNGIGIDIQQQTTAAALSITCSGVTGASGVSVTYSTASASGSLVATTIAPSSGTTTSKSLAIVVGSGAGTVSGNIIDITATKHSGVCINIAKSPAAALGGNGITLTMNSNCTGQGILVTYSGTGTAALYADCSGIVANGSSSCPLAITGPSGNNSYKITTQQTSTTDATQTTAWTITTNNNTGIKIRAWVLARRSGGNFACFDVTASYDNNAGTVALIGVVQSLTAAQTSGTGLTTACTFDINGADVRLRVTGNALETWTWEAFVEYQQTG